MYTWCLYLRLFGWRWGIQLLTCIIHIIIYSEVRYYIDTSPKKKCMIHCTLVIIYIYCTAIMRRIWRFIQPKWTIILEGNGFQLKTCVFPLNFIHIQSIGGSSAGAPLSHPPFESLFGTCMFDLLVSKSQTIDLSLPPPSWNFWIRHCRGLVSQDLKYMYLDYLNLIIKYKGCVKSIIYTLAGTFFSLH